jgi:DNA repair protein RadC
MSKSTNEKSIHAGHRKRVKSNVYKNGFEQLEDHKLLELLLFYSIPREDTNELAHRLLDEFGSLSEVIKASPSRLARVSGIGGSSAILLSSIGELCMRVLKEGNVKRTPYKSQKEIIDLVKSHYLNEEKERFLIICFDANMRMKRALFISEGDSMHVDFDIKTMLSKVLEFDYVVKLNGVAETGVMVVKSARDNIATMVDKTVADAVDKLRNEASDMGLNTTERMSSKSSKFRLMLELGDLLTSHINNGKGIYVNGDKLKFFEILPDIVATPNGKIKKISLEVEVSDIDKSKEMMYVKDIEKSVENCIKGLKKTSHSLDRDGILRVGFSLDLKFLKDFITLFKLDESWIMENLCYIAE